ncbi:RNA polymerase sigma factor [Microscilla marina]|uniref:RNA polymerase sigma factor n=1 Tax=Microscilla marina ATCC 23134 TaxID=313606 RepID=A1ZXF7_MICM2|nr:RNA polymerase sigma factor [Microscilla marina]EAY24925.1 RNA polymerase ECF-type sigma factor, putative [Microscilla marina ATCC 23134]
MNNPLSDKYSEEQNRTLVEKSLNGDRKAIEELIHLHQPFIYNVAWKMVHDPNDALDLTQETLLKVITKLSQFNFKSAFRTWLYRIVVNEFLQTKRRKGAQRFSSFEDYGAKLDSIPNPDLNEEEYITFQELSREMQVKCMSGMLMCLTREQRLIYIIGDTFGANHRIGAEIFDLTPPNFRVKLHRARKELYNFMNNKCGLVNQDNPCRCPKKTKALKKMGLLDENNLQFNISYKNKIALYVAPRYEETAQRFEEKYTELYREHPTKEDFSAETIVSEILNDDNLLKYFK